MHNSKLVLLSVETLGLSTDVWFRVGLLTVSVVCVSHSINTHCNLEEAACSRSTHNE
jgi:hypothetical protein